MVEINLGKIDRFVKNRAVAAYSWCNENIIIKLSKSGMITGTVFTAALMVITILCRSSFLDLEYTSRWFLWQQP